VKYQMKFQESIFQIIKKRSSFRKYQEVEITNESLKKLKKEIKRPLKGLFNNSITIKLVELSNEMPDSSRLTSGMIRGAKAFLVGITEESTQEAYVDFGFAFEHIILKATELGLGTCWLGQTFRKDFFSRVLRLEPEKEIPAITPLGYPVKKGGIKDSLISLAIGSKRRKGWENLFFKSDFQHPLTLEQAGDFADILELVRWGPSSRNSQPWRIIKEKGNIFHFYLEAKEKAGTKTLPRMRLLDIGIALCHFALGTKERKMEGTWLKQQPEITVKGPTLHYIISWQGKE